MTPRGSFEMLVARDLGGWSDIDWEQFWGLSRTVEPERAASIIRATLTRPVWRPTRPRTLDRHGRSRSSGFEPFPADTEQSTRL